MDLKRIAVGVLAGAPTATRNRVDLSAAAIAGMVAGVAYVAEMAFDLQAFGHETDDLRLLGGTFARDRAAARGVGMVMHLGASVGFGVLYAAVARERLPGPPWLRGVLFANIENVVLYPIARLDKHHPAIERGEVDRYWTVTAFFQSIPRHVAYGAVLGALYERLRFLR